MKWILLIIILGVAEIATIGELHSIFGTRDLVVLYVITTAIGALFLYLKSPELRIAMKAMKRIDKKFKKKMRGPGYKPTTKEIEKLSPLIFMGIYMPALVLIAIPGIISDVVGTLMVFPYLSNWLVGHQVKKAMASAEIKP